MGKIGEHAVVLGTSMAGLLAAQVLTEAYERVTLVDRDGPPPAGQQRKGVPQGRHAHILLPRGQRALEELFPGICDDLRRAGAVVANPGTNISYTLGGRTLSQFASEDQVIHASRPLLEATVRARVAALPGVAFVTGCDAVGLVAPDSARITGVRLIRRTPGSAEQQLDADLVIDAMGRGSRTPVWLERLGYAAPPVNEIRIDVSYASRYYRLSPQALAGAKGVVIGPRPQLSRGLAMLAVEGDRWLVTLAGVGAHNRPPTDPDGYLWFAESVTPLTVFLAIRGGTPLGEVVTHRYPADVWRRYERIRLPGGLLVIGDAMCCLNPIYAQGMTIAALQALELRRALSRGSVGLTRRYFRAAARVITGPWRMAVAAELAMPEVEGSRGLMTRLLTAYTDRVQAAAVHDSAVAGQFMRVIGLLEPPTRLLRLTMLARVLGRLESPIDSPSQRLVRFDGALP
jgi:2-polyprenyl-6-methoxyphenol hydroxylase-like FAD-dependent oxidoreductase